MILRLCCDLMFENTQTLNNELDQHTCEKDDSMSRERVLCSVSENRERSAGLLMIHTLKLV